LAKRLFQPNGLLSVFGSMVGSHLGGALFGLVFWMIAARALTPEQVGLGAALVAAMTLLSMLGLFGVGTLLLERFKSVAIVDRWPLFSTGLAVAGSGGALVAVAWLGVSGLAHLDGVLGDLSLGTVLLLVGASVIAAACAAFDQAVIGMGASGVQLRRNLVASCLRVGFLCGAIAFDFKSGQAILISWMVGLGGSLLASRLRSHVLPRSGVSTRQRWHLVRDHWPAAVGHHGLTLAMVSGPLLLPIVVALTMSAEETAYFSQARLLADTALAVPYFLTIALFATAEDLASFGRNARRTIALGMVMALGLFAGSAVLGRDLLGLFGPEYAQQSLPLLLLLLAAGPILVIKDHFAVLRRLQGRRMAGAVAMALWTTVELTGAIVGSLFGSTTTLCLGWLAMSAVCALICIPFLIKGIRGVPSSSGAAAAVEADRALAEFWTAYVEAGRIGVRYVIAHPLSFVRGARHIRRLPVVHAARPSLRSGGLAVREMLQFSGPLGTPARWWGSAALAVPADASEYVTGPHAQTLRRKIRAAARQGISCRPVPPAERTDLLALANLVQQNHYDEQYRVSTPHNDDLLLHDLWMLAEDNAGKPLLLAVIPVDGELATLRYFRTLGAGELYSLSRYLATEAVVAELSKRGARWLLDTSPPGAQTNGVRHFQRMVRFRYVRIRLTSRGIQAAGLTVWPTRDCRDSAVDRAPRGATGDEPLTVGLQPVGPRMDAGLR
jgi:O-antigen/teichoic acid export membrane protein